jgi:transposase
LRQWGQTAIALLILTGNFTLFGDARKFACFAGIAPFGRQSGKSVYRKAKVSKIGNGQIKSLLSMCTGAAIRTDPQIKEYHQKKRKEGKPEGVVRNAIMNKIIHRVFAVINRGTAFVSLAQHARA